MWVLCAGVPFGCRSPRKGGPFCTPNHSLRLLQGRAGLNLDKVFLEITARKGGDDLVALLRRVLIVSNPDDVHQNARVCERDFGPHVLGDTGRGMERDGLPNQVRFRLGDAMASEKFARGVGAINFKPLRVGMKSVDKPQVVKHAAT